MLKLILASASPRRRELLQQVGLSPDCIPVDVDESALTAEQPIELVERLARSKATSCALRLSAADKAVHGSPAPFLGGSLGVPGSIPSNIVIIGADTVLDLDGRILAKPDSREDFLATMEQLSAREHTVISGVCIIGVGQLRSFTVSTAVRFAPVTVGQAKAYWDSGEPADKAGGYAIQGLGARFVEHLSGSYSNVVGLPLFETLELLEQVGVIAVPESSQ